jgi:uncharacterized protein YbjQ (UPF0145 family)
MASESTGLMTALLNKSLLSQLAMPPAEGQPVQTIEMLMSNTETIPGQSIIQMMGVVTGSTVRAKHIGKDILAGFKNIVGGELKGYTELLQEARAQALQRLVMEAHSRGANAIVNIRFATSAIAGGAAELMAYGTAVVVG